MQKITFIISIILISLFLSCKNENKETVKAQITVTTADTAAIKDYVDFPVYNLAHNTTAIVITMFESDPKADEFQKIYTRINEQIRWRMGFTIQNLQRLKNLNIMIL